jgi:phosphoglycerate dehydrogenase-like enzyme
MKVLIHIAWPVKAWCIPDTHVERLRKHFPAVEFVNVPERPRVADAIADADAEFTAYLTPEILAPAKRLRWVHSPAAAVEGLLPLEELARRGIPVTNSRGIQAVPIAEQVLGGLLVLARRLNVTLAAQREQRWVQNDLAVDWPYTLNGRAMTIVGLGTIGAAIASRAHAFGMRVTGVRRRPDQPLPAGVDRVVGPEQLHDALRGCDILVLAAPSGSATNRMIGAAEIAALNPGAVVANVARGSMIDEAAMIDALRNGHLGGAVLDVFEKEPLDPASPLWTLPNVVISPHSSGLRAAHWDEVLALFIDNLERFQRGEPLRNPVDCAAGY